MLELEGCWNWKDAERRLEWDGMFAGMVWNDCWKGLEGCWKWSGIMLEIGWKDAGNKV